MHANSVHQAGVVLMMGSRSMMWWLMMGSRADTDHKEGFGKYPFLLFLTIKIKPHLEGRCPTAAQSRSVLSTSFSFALLKTNNPKTKTPPKLLLLEQQQHSSAVCTGHQYWCGATNLPLLGLGSV